MYSHLGALAGPVEAPESVAISFDGSRHAVGAGHGAYCTRARGRARRLRVHSAGAGACASTAGISTRAQGRRGARGAGAYARTRARGRARRRRMHSAGAGAGACASTAHTHAGAGAYTSTARTYAGAGMARTAPGAGADAYAGAGTCAAPAHAQRGGRGGRVRAQHIRTAYTGTARTYAGAGTGTVRRVRGSGGGTGAVGVGAYASTARAWHGSRRIRVRRVRHRGQARAQRRGGRGCGRGHGVAAAHPRGRAWAQRGHSAGGAYGAGGSCGHTAGAGTTRARAHASLRLGRHLRGGECRVCVRRLARELSGAGAGAGGASTWLVIGAASCQAAQWLACACRMCHCSHDMWDVREMSGRGERSHFPPETHLLGPPDGAKLRFDRAPTLCTSSIGIRALDGLLAAARRARTRLTVRWTGATRPRWTGAHARGGQGAHARGRQAAHARRRQVPHARGQQMAHERGGQRALSHARGGHRTRMHARSSCPAVHAPDQPRKCPAVPVHSHACGGQGAYTHGGQGTHARGGLEAHARGGRRVMRRTAWPTPAADMAPAHAQPAPAPASPCARTPAADMAPEHAQPAPAPASPCRSFALAAPAPALGAAPVAAHAPSEMETTDQAPPAPALRSARAWRPPHAADSGARVRRAGGPRTPCPRTYPPSARPTCPAVCALARVADDASRGQGTQAHGGQRTVRLASGGQVAHARPAPHLPRHPHTRPTPPCARPRAAGDASPGQGTHPRGGQRGTRAVDRWPMRGGHGANARGTPNPPHTCPTARAHAGDTSRGGQGAHARGGQRGARAVDRWPMRGGGVAHTGDASRGRAAHAATHIIYS
ncbi:hypothetical protein GGX14DRAFT_586536 [Mycena pura]|uniref:Uncharacterized protein n=1 Tax=Mycena pura TaxID=153505 RepID=A0AAD6VS56_9AGAR|nr:hypothetical protein GGX14DRAFT_586536 [Mycena pura]